MYIIGKTELLLIVTIWRFDVIRNCHTLMASNPLSANTIFSHGRCSKCLPPAFTNSSTYFYIGLYCDSIVLRKISLFFSLQCNFNSDVLASKEASFQEAFCVDHQTWHLQMVKIWRVRCMPMLCFRNHLQAVRVHALLSDTLHPAAVGSNLQ